MENEISQILNNQDHLKTSELSLAASLVYFGFPLSRLEPTDSRRLNFVFHLEKGLDEIVQGYWADTLSVNPKRYFYTLKELKSRVVAQRNEYGSKG